MLRPHTPHTPQAHSQPQGRPPPHLHLCDLLGAGQLLNLLLLLLQGRVRRRQPLLRRGQLLGHAGRVLFQPLLLGCQPRGVVGPLLDDRLHVVQLGQLSLELRQLGLQRLHAPIIAGRRAAGRCRCCCHRCRLSQEPVVLELQRRGLGRDVCQLGLQAGLGLPQAPHLLTQLRPVRPELRHERLELGLPAAGLAAGGGAGAAAREHEARRGGRARRVLAHDAAGGAGRAQRGRRRRCEAAHAAPQLVVLEPQVGDGGALELLQGLPLRQELVDLRLQRGDALRRGGVVGGQLLRGGLPVLRGA